MLEGKPVALEIETVGGEFRKINSYQYTTSIQDMQRNIIEIKVLGIEKISNSIGNIDVKQVIKEFKKKDAAMISRPTNGTVDILIGYQYAAYHPVPIETIGHLLLMKNRFGILIAGSHRDIQERTKRLVKHAAVLHLKPRTPGKKEVEVISEKDQVTALS